MTEKEEKKGETIEIKENKSFLTEYEVINQWRNNVVTNDYIMTYIFIPLSISIFLSYFLIESPPSKWIFWGFPSFLILLWRFYAHNIDRKILDVYPRIYELEEKLRFRFTRDYLTRIFLNKSVELESDLPCLQEIKKAIEDFKKWKWYIIKSFHSRYSRGHWIFNWLSLLLVISGFICMKFFIHSLCLRNFMKC